MSTTAEALAGMMLLLPGFFSSSILNALITRKQHDNLARVVEALVFSFVIYAIAVGVRREPAPSNFADVGVLLLSKGALASIVALATLLPVLVAASVNHGWHMHLFRRLGVSRKLSRLSVWDQVLDGEDRWVMVHLASGRRVWGYPIIYSDEPSERFLYLWGPAWVKEGKDGDEYVELGVKGLLLTDADPIESIAFSTTKGD